MLDEVLRELFGTMVYKWPVKELYGGEFKIENGSIELPFLLEGQYFRIVGSVFNDGVHQYPAQDLTDEVFCGAIWALALPPALINFAAEVEKWQAENGEKTKSPYQSESFGGYSYTAKTGENGKTFTWKDEFASELRKWRKI